MLADHAFVVVDYLPANHSLFILQMTTHPCPAGSRAWSKSLSNVGCGQKVACLPIATNSSAPPATWIAAASVSFLFNLTSLTNAHSSRSSLRSAATYAISTPTTTANGTLSSSTGAQPRLDIASPPEQRQFTTWRRASRTPLMPSLFFFRFNG